MVHPKICKLLLLITLKTFDHIQNILNVVKKLENGLCKRVRQRNKYAKKYIPSLGCLELIDRN